MGSIEVGINVKNSYLFSECTLRYHWHQERILIFFGVHTRTHRGEADPAFTLLDAPDSVNYKENCISFLRLSYSTYQQHRERRWRWRCYRMLLVRMLSDVLRTPLGG